MNTENKFEWTDELVKEFADYVKTIFNERHNYCGKYDHFDTDFEKWKTSKSNEYILMNKPVLSVNDVISKIRRCCDGAFSENTDGWDFTDKVSDLVKQVQELAKSKIEGK